MLNVRDFRQEISLINLRLRSLDVPVKYEVVSHNVIVQRVVMSPEGPVHDERTEPRRFNYDESYEFRLLRIYRDFSATVAAHFAFEDERS